MLSLASIANIPKVPELRKRVVFTLLMLAVYRIGSFITVPGVDRNAMHEYASKQSGNLFSFFNMFSGGALQNLSIFALTIMPYVSASIFLQLMGMIYKPIEEMKKEGEQGRRKLDQYTRYGTILISIFQAFGIAKMAEGISKSGATTGVVIHPGPSFQLLTILTLTTGTAFLMWIGEQMTERGISNGISLLIFANIISNSPRTIFEYFSQNKGDIQPLTIAAVVVVFVASIAIIAFFENGRREIPIVYSRRQQVGRRVYGAQTAHLPLKVNTAGTIPPIFATSLLSFPTTIAQVIGDDKFQSNANSVSPSSLRDWVSHIVHELVSFLRSVSLLSDRNWAFNLGYAMLIVFFCYFYTNIVFQPVDVAENLKKQQANIPGIRPGKQTADYIYSIVQRITFGGAIYVATICIVPSLIGHALGVSMSFAGTSLMIVVGVALDVSNQIESQLITKNYEGLSGSNVGKVRGRQLVES